MLYGTTQICSATGVNRPFGVVEEWVLAYPYCMKCALAVVACRDRTSQTFFTDDLVDEGKGNAMQLGDR